MVTPKPKLIAAPTTIPGRGGKNHQRIVGRHTDECRTVYPRIKWNGIEGKR
jgi:hypothetical protein